MKPSIGKTVLFLQKKPAGYGEGFLQLPAIITAVCSDTCVNLQVFTDGSNSEGGEHGQQSVKWVTSVNLDPSISQPRTWNWPDETVI